VQRGLRVCSSFMVCIQACRLITGKLQRDVEHFCEGLQQGNTVLLQQLLAFAPIDVTVLRADLLLDSGNIAPCNKQCTLLSTGWDPVATRSCTRLFVVAAVAAEQVCDKVYMLTATDRQAVALDTSMIYVGQEHNGGRLHRAHPGCRKGRWLSMASGPWPH